MKTLTEDELLKIKLYLDSVGGINYALRQDLVVEWEEVYGIVYNALNETTSD